MQMKTNSFYDKNGIVNLNVLGYLKTNKSVIKYFIILHIAHKLRLLKQ